MVKAELIYNPYLLQTEVRFNGNPPRINSLVEKYQNEKLQTWVGKVPSIFYDEMNGYDFELDFSGTELDFEEVKKSFLNAGVKHDRVQIFHKGELDSRKDKLKEIDELLEWLEKTPNRKFDLGTFKERYRDLFEGAYAFVVIGGTSDTEKLFDQMAVSIDCVETAAELRNTDLKSTPIVLCLNRKTMGALQNNLQELVKRTDVAPEQLFFMISPSLGGKVERVIKDLGIINPQIISSLNDPKIERYLEIFPVTEYIFDSIAAFREQAETIGTILNTANRLNEITNKSVHEKINHLEELQTRLKKTYEEYMNKDNLEYPIGFTREFEDLISKICYWKSRKTKITKTEEAVTLSKDLNGYANFCFEQFQNAIIKIYDGRCSDILVNSESLFKSADYKKEYTVQGISPKQLTNYYIPSFEQNLLNLKEEQYVVPEKAFFGKIFKTQDGESTELVLETTYYCEKWRAYVTDLLKTIANTLTKEAYDSMCLLQNQLTDAYTQKIRIFLEEVSKEKEHFSSQLSSDEQLLQTDNDWYIEFCDKLHHIERALLWMSYKN